MSVEKDMCGRVGKKISLQRDQSHDKLSTGQKLQSLRYWQQAITCKHVYIHKLGPGFYNADILASRERQTNVESLQGERRLLTYADISHHKDGCKRAHMHMPTHKAGCYSSWIIPPPLVNLHSTEHLPPPSLHSPGTNKKNQTKGTSRTALASNFSLILRSPPQWLPVWHSHIHGANDSLPATTLYNCPDRDRNVSPPRLISISWAKRRIRVTSENKGQNHGES